ncbi:MAG: 30S ribosomal protein S14 [Halobacteriovoraceae bacterium]|jgi:small subunit ribosomal protein S14|nr:30S ribosomal protein S14 [Halobacteriovoraceae bacterium]MBT5094699.1 30S ribosomal protein S14 [Halobacteriovoraceae bacterium]
MARIAKIQSNLKRQKLAARYKSKRDALRKIMQDPKAPFDEKADAQRQLQALPRNSNPNRVRNRCEVTGRPRSFYRAFRVSRLVFRRMALQGLIPGITKSSW